MPDWLHLLPAGEVRTKDGRGPYRVRNAHAVMSASIAGGKLPIDENHAIDLAAPNGKPAPARGWIVELQQRADGIWGRVDWTNTGRRMMRDREYGALAPVILHGPDGSVSSILRASLTNSPSIMGLRSLHAAVRPVAGPTAADPAIVRKARDIQAMCERAGLPIDFASALASAMAEEAPEAPGSSELSAVDLHMIQRLGLDRAAYSAALRPPVPHDGLGAADVEIIGKLGIDRTAYAASKAGPVVPSGLSAVDQEMIARLGLDPADYAKALARAG